MPYSAEIMAMSLLPKFKVSQIEMYDESKNPIDHLEIFNECITFHSFPTEIACKAFALILRGMARGWFRNLKPGLIDSFELLAKQFLTQFMPCRRCRHPVAYLLTVKQREE